MELKTHAKNKVLSLIIPGAVLPESVLEKMIGSEYQNLLYIQQQRCN